MANTLDNSGSERAQAMRLRDFLHDCTGSAPCEEADRVRDAIALLGGGGLDGTVKLDLERIDAMLASGAALNAVLEILGRDTAFMLSRGSEACLATVVPSGASEEANGEGSTLALAMLAGHISAVLARVEQASQQQQAPSLPASMLLH